MFFAFRPFLCARNRANCFGSKLGENDQSGSFFVELYDSRVAQLVARTTPISIHLKISRLIPNWNLGSGQRQSQFLSYWVRSSINEPEKFSTRSGELWKLQNYDFPPRVSLWAFFLLYLCRSPFSANFLGAQNNCYSHHFFHTSSAHDTFFLRYLLRLFFFVV